MHERSKGRITLSRHAIERHLLDNWLRLFGYAVSLTGDRETARDLLQQSALHALAAKRPPDSGGSACAWLFRIVRNAWIDQHRRATVREAVPAAEPLDGERWHFDDRLIAALTVRQALDRLEPMHREVIEVVDISGFRYREAAEILDVPVGTVMSRLSRARLALLDAIGGNVRSLDAARRRTS
jgi:RNA polymerase sigma-70 factor (ECF subfamily)